jgi:hypothetical protein
MQNTTSVNTRTFSKGMVKDLNDTYTGEGTWTHARNAVNNSEHGDVGVIGNEPANKKCIEIKYLGAQIIGFIYLGDNQWAVYSTNNKPGAQQITPISEIGLFDEKTCTYNIIVRDTGSCLNFSQLYPIIGVSKGLADCTTQLYWDDGNNPSRTMNIGDPAAWPYPVNDVVNPPLHWEGVPYVQRNASPDPDCKDLVDTTQLDCDKLRLVRLTDVPCISVSKGDGLGTLPNGSYQATIAYTKEGVRVTDYLALSNLQPLWDHDNQTGSLQIDLTNIDSDYDEFELVIISSVNQQTVCKRIGVYSTSTTSILLDAINADLITVPIEQIPINSLAYERTEAMYEVNNYLIRVAPTTTLDFNYQPLANQIKAKWVSADYPADYYYKGGNKPSFMRDEVYSFFIRWVYKTGEKSSSYHIPGRAAEPARDLYTVNGPDTSNVPLPRWRIESTAYKTDFTTFDRLSDGGVVTSKGRMGYWESTEKYPDNKPDVWGDLCGKPIRHHKMPEDILYDDRRRPIEQVKLYNTTFNTINLLGVEFENISRPVDNDGRPISNIVGYEILVGSREGHRSIIAKGLLNNMRSYEIPNNITNKKGLYVNYPYNSTNFDPYLARDKDSVQAGDAYTQTKGGTKDNDLFDTITGDDDVILFDGIEKSILSFHSPETTFRNPFLSATELKVYGETIGDVVGKFTEAENHPKHKLITDATFILASAAGAVIGKSAATEASGGIIGKLTDLIKNVALFAIPGIGPILGAAGLAKDKLEDAILFGYFFIESTDNIMEGIKGFSKFQQYALKYISHGFYNRIDPLPIDERRRTIQNSIYLQPSIAEFTENYRVNNINRSKTVVLEIDADLSTERDLHPTRYDDTLFTLRNVGKQQNNRRLPANTSANDLYRSPWNYNFRSATYAKYAALKLDIQNQYGQLEQIKQIPAGCIQIVQPGNAFAKFTSDYIFGGDVYVNRYTEKNTFFYFSNWMENMPNGTEYDYRLYNMLPYPRYWMDTSTFDTANFFSGLVDSVIGDRDTAVTILPNDKHHLDRDGYSGFFVLRDAYMYLFNSGVRDFYVESEINLAHRDFRDGPGERHYDFHTYSDFEELFRMNNIRFNNYYRYDYSLSKSKFFSNFISWATLQSRYYDPLKAESCYQYYPERVLYSLPQDGESVKDSWRHFLTNNYYDFGSRVTSMRPVGGSGAIILLEGEAPILMQGTEEIDLNSGTKLTIGDGSLFSAQPLKNIVNVDYELEYGSCQNRLSVANTPSGIFYISLNQGKVFNYASGLQDISRAGMEWWFEEYAPYKILLDFPDFDLLDNSVLGVAAQTVYDNNNEVIYFMKRDYKLRPEWKNKLYYIKEGTFATSPLSGSISTYGNIYIGDPRYFIDASWTISYDIKSQAWISFHDWKPNFALATRNGFLTSIGNTTWKHNDRCDLYANYYGVNYPFEVEYVQNQGQEVTTIRNVEYILECYKYDEDCYDKYHVLNENFDRAVIYNSEQTSGNLNLILSPVSAYAQLSYPIINSSSIDILYSKVEQKYRFNQFWDITNDRAVQIPMWDTEANGYIRNINPTYVNYNKGATERKKFRHYVNKVLLSKIVSGSNKFLLKLTNNKLLKSFR